MSSRQFAVVVKSRYIYRSSISVADLGIGLHVTSSLAGNLAKTYPGNKRVDKVLKKIQYRSESSDGIACRPFPLCFLPTLTNQRRKKNLQNLYVMFRRSKKQKVPAHPLSI
jgi:hypothetical protein